jgi:putative transposase
MPSSAGAIRVLSVVDAYTRKGLALEVDTSFASRRVTRVLEEIMAGRGVPLSLRCDNGPELTSRHFLAWAIEHGIELLHIQPGKPVQNGRLESFHARLREECLRVSWFQNRFDARRKIAAWQKEYNEERPHSSLGYLTSNEFAAQAAEGFAITGVGQETSNAAPCPTPPSPLEARLVLTSTFVFSSMRSITPTMILFSIVGLKHMSHPVIHQNILHLHYQSVGNRFGSQCFVLRLLP